MDNSRRKVLPMLTTVYSVSQRLVQTNMSNNVCPGDNIVNMSGDQYNFVDNKMRQRLVVWHCFMVHYGVSLQSNVSYTSQRPILDQLIQILPSLCSLKCPPAIHLNDPILIPGTSLETWCFSLCLVFHRNHYMASLELSKMSLCWTWKY